MNIFMKNTVVKHLILIILILPPFQIYSDTMYAVSNNTFWFSIDRGQNWQRMASSAPWTGSNYQRAAVFNNKIWVFTDKGIWYSTDTP